jgi:probable rRNA maturation factor
VTVLEAEVFKVVRSPVRPAFVREVLVQAAGMPEVAARLPETRATVAVRITSDAELRRHNRAFAGEDDATDVLSFAGAGDHVGDLAISWPMVVRQAAEHGHDEDAELALLAVHGLLHLLGWDHSTAAGRSEMNRLTRAALRRAGLTLAKGRL